MRIALFCAGCALLTAMYSPVQAQPAAQDTMTCEARGNHDGDRVQYAEPRQQTLAQSSLNKVNSSPNGRIVIHGADRSDVLVHACIHTAAPTDQEARSLASQVQITKGPGEIEPNGPKTERDRYWSVSYEVWVPRQSNLNATNVNGGIRIEDVDGNIEASNVNGGMHLARLAGQVKTHTVNGGVRIELAGSSWRGQGLNVSTTNGGIHFTVPANYSANVDVSTVNGGIHCDFPISVQGKLTKHVSFQIGGGGAEIHSATVNGGIHFSRGA
jgi:DUF4097 and DUF4098 domain-containing protein YvlB